MRDVIQKIIATEGEAKRTVETAEAEAERILSDARKKGRDTLEQTRQTAILEAGRIVQSAVEGADREKEELLARAAAEVEARIQLDPATKEWAVKEVIRCVCEGL